MITMSVDEPIFIKTKCEYLSNRTTKNLTLFYIVTEIYAIYFFAVCFFNISHDFRMLISVEIFCGRQ